MSTNKLLVIIKIKKMENVIITSYVLVASKKLAKGSYCWINSYDRKAEKMKETAHIIAVDCEKTEEIPAKIKEFITNVEETHPEARETLAGLKEYDRMLSEDLYRKDIPNGLLAAIRNQFSSIRKEDCIYLTGVTGIN